MTVPHSPADGRSSCAVSRPVLIESSRDVTIDVLRGLAIFLMVLFSSLQGIYVASLYRYATEGDAPGGFDVNLLGEAFVPKGR